MKILTDLELADMTRQIIQEAEIDDYDVYKRFLTSLAEVVTEYFGGDVESATYIKEDGIGWIVVIQHNDSVPEDGGIYKNYDPEVSWADRKET